VLTIYRCLEWRVPSLAHRRGHQVRVGSLYRAL